MLHESSATLPQRRPKFFYGWYIVAASVAMNFYLSISFFQGFQIFFLPILNEFGWSRTLASGAFSLRQFESGILAPLVGFLVDRWGARTIILGSVVVAGAGMIFLSMISSIWTFYLSFLIISIGMSGASHGISWPAIVVRWFTRRRGRALGLAVMGPVVGGPFLIITQLLEEGLGWRTAILILGIGMWIVGIPLALVARQRPEDYGLLPDGDVRKPELPVATGLIIGETRGKDGDEGPDGMQYTVAQAMRSRAFWALVLILGLHGLGVSGLMVHQVPLFQEIGFSARESSVGLGFIFFLSGIGRMSGGMLMDLFDRRLVLLGALLGQTVSFLMLPFMQTWWQMVLFSLVFGISFGTIVPSRPMIMSYLFGQRTFGALQGLAQSATIITALVGPLIMGASYDYLGGYNPAIYLFAGITVAVTPLIFLVKRPEPMKVEAPSSVA